MSRAVRARCWRAMSARPREPVYHPAIPGWFCAPSTTTFVPLIHDARGEQEARDVGDLLRPAEPPERELVAHPPLERLGVLAAAVVPAAAGEQDRARAERVD